MLVMESECQCNTPMEMEIAGEAMVLCHHTPLPKLAEIQDKLENLLLKFDKNIEPAKLFQMAPAEGVEYYIKEIIQDDPTLATRMERAVYTTMYVKHYNVVMQLMMLKALTGIRKGDFN